MEECTTDGREWLKACDTEDMTRETTADENEEENGTDVESLIVLTTSFNPDLYKGVNFFKPVQNMMPMLGACDDKTSFRLCSVWNTQPVLLSLLLHLRC